MEKLYFYWNKFFNINFNTTIKIYFRILSLISSLLVLVFPETHGRELMNTMDEAKVFYKKSFTF